MFVCYVVYLFVLQPSIKDAAADLPVVVCLKEMKISDILI